MSNAPGEGFLSSTFSDDGQFNPEFIRATSELGDNEIKNTISLIVMVLNSIAGDSEPDLLRNTNLAQLYAEGGNYQASFNLIANACSLLSHEADEKTKEILISIQEVRHYLDILWNNPAIRYEGRVVTLGSIDVRRAAVFFIIQSKNTIPSQQIDRLKAFLREKGLSVTGI